MSRLIAVLDDDDRRLSEMSLQLANLLPEYQWYFFDNAPAIIEWLKSNLSSLSLISLDHDLGPNRMRDQEIFDPGIGRDVVNFLITQEPVCHIIIHSSNAMEVPGMKFALEFAGWRHSWVIPFNDLEWIKIAWVQEVIKRIE